MPVQVRWPDGAVTRAPNASEALDIVAAKQWEQPMSVAALKYVLAARAHGWNGAVIDPTMPDEQFLRALGETGMVFVAFNNRDPWE